MNLLASSISSAATNANQKLIEQALHQFGCNDIEQCQSTLKKLINTGQSTDIVAQLKKQCDLHSNSTLRAIDNYRQILTQLPENTDVKLHLAKLIFQNGDIDDAHNILLEAHESDPENSDVALSLSHTYSVLGLPHQQLKILLQQQKKNPKLPNIEAIISQTLNTLNNDDLFELPEEDLISIITFKNINPAPLSSSTSRYLSNKYQLKDEDCQLDMSQLATDDLIISSLKRFCLMNAEVENLLIQLRRSILLDVAQSACIQPENIALTEAIALNNALNEYVHPIACDEQELVNGLISLLDISLMKIAESGKQKDCLEKTFPLLLTISLYTPLHDLACRDSLVAIPLKNWPKSLQSIAKNTLFDISDEISRATKIPAITSIDNEVSLAVQEQYEQNPYPRWLRLSQLKTQTVAESIENFAPYYTAPKSLKNNKLNILVAGCGTGHQPLTSAVTHPKANIMAVDISRRSLAYAIRKAEDYKVNNVDFFQGDILKLHEIKQRFDLIECGGVLHHLKDPIAGWQSLCQLLNNDGVMRIALYSKIARTSIRQQRAAINELKIEPTKDNIRKYRQAFMQHSPKSDILNWFDFWNLSECRDLLFHRQEHQYTWPLIQQCCDILKLKVVAIHVPPNVLNAYKLQFPDDIGCCNLDNWHQFELKNPHTFRAMYNFICEKINDEQ